MLQNKMHSKVITLRNLPPEVARRVREEADRMGVSLNRAVIRMLMKALGLDGPEQRPRVHHDFDRFAGTWSKKEAAAFEKGLSERRGTDSELWE